MHNQKGFDIDIQKPEIISYYNSTKGGVDALDEKCSIYSTGRRTRRWPMAIFTDFWTFLVLIHIFYTILLKITKR